MKTLREEWDRFAGFVLPATVSEVQHDETKKAFYAGALVAFDAMRLASETKTEADEQRWAEHLDRMASEAESYCRAQAELALRKAGVP